MPNSLSFGSSICQMRLSFYQQTLDSVEFAGAVRGPSLSEVGSQPWPTRVWPTPILRRYGVRMYTNATSEANVAVQIDLDVPRHRFSH